MDLEQYLIDNIAAEKAYLFESKNKGDLISENTVDTLDYILSLIAQYHDDYD